MDVVKLERKFKVTVDGEELTLDDPNPSMSLKEVQKYLSGLYPELVTATYDEPEIEGTVQIFSFTKKIADKG